MKLRLNVEELNDDFFEDTRLLGITAPVKNYPVLFAIEQP